MLANIAFLTDFTKQTNTPKHFTQSFLANLSPGRKPQLLPGNSRVLMFILAVAKPHQRASKAL